MQATIQMVQFIQRAIPGYDAILSQWKINLNLCENAIRPFVIGRKNSLFSDTVSGAKASANLYNLIETAKANDIESYARLKQVFTELPKATCMEEVEALLPVRPVTDLDQVA